MCGRFRIRLKRNGLKLDDVFNGLALVALIAFSAVNQVRLDFPDGAYSASQYSTLYTYALIQGMLGWVTLYLVKASFLTLCQSIFGTLRTFRRVWWIVTIYTFITFWPIVFSQVWQCGDPSHPINGWSCLSIANTEDVDSIESTTTKYGQTTTYIALAFHISSDLLIMIMPLPVIRRLQISKAQKIGITAVFGLVLVDIVMGVLRNSMVICEYSHPDLIPLGSASCLTVAAIMSVCEPCIAVVVCALPAYGVLLPTIHKRRNQAKRQRQNGAKNFDPAHHGSDSDARLTEEGYTTENLEMDSRIEARNGL